MDQIVVNNNLDSISINHHGSDNSYYHDNGVGNKLHKFQIVCVTISRNLRNKALKGDENEIL